MSLLQNVGQLQNCVTVTKIAKVTKMRYSYSKRVIVVKIVTI